MKITLIQILTLFVVAASLLAMSQLPSHGDWIWRESTLVYDLPTVPAQFNENGRKPPYSRLGGTLIEINMDECEDGQAYFKSRHRLGWERCRYRFVMNESSDMVDQPELSSLPIDSWDEHGAYAFALGYNECSKQIDDLLLNHTKPNLVNRICYSKNWHAIPLMLMFLAAVSAFAIQRQRQSSDNKSLDRSRQA